MEAYLYQQSHNKPVSTIVLITRAYVETLLAIRAKKPRLPTYKEYIIYAKAKRFQPIKEEVFNALLAAGFNPITGRWNN